MFLADKLQQMRDEFAPFEDPHDRLSALVERSKRIPPLRPSERVEANRVHACVSVVWLVGEVRDNRCHFRADAESPIVRALVIFLSDFFTGAPVAEVVTSELEPLEALGVLRHLSPTRRNGIAAVRNAIRAFALQSVSGAR